MWIKRNHRCHSYHIMILANQLFDQLDKLLPEPLDENDIGQQICQAVVEVEGGRERSIIASVVGQLYPEPQ